jgi:hypothetical protein
MDKFEEHTSGAKQLAEKVLQRRNYREGLLQGLKPDADWIGFIGPTKVVPLLQSLRSGHLGDFFRST